MIESVFSRCESWLGEDENGNFVLVDPHEHEAIGHHYALSHYCAAAILGCEPGGRRFQQGIAILRSVLKRWDRDSAIPGFHNDFNNFALVLVHDELERLDMCEPERKEIERLVLSTPDSNHDTVNWLPMRMLADAARLRWGGKDERALQRCVRKIRRASNEDGLIEDRLPRGTSFNLQYDVSSVALLDFIEGRGIDQPLDLEKAFSALIACSLPDGDINYLGRGCNQVFAWGPWVYLLKRYGTESEWDGGVGYLADRLPTMLENENILLNDLCGAQRQLWWDYHFCSVYTAHLLLWLVLARDAESHAGVRGGQHAALSDTGVQVFRSDRAMAVTFSGRREYLAEKGPEVSAVWTARYGSIHKGSFGPWLKAFGYKHSSPTCLFNHLGLLEAGGLAGISLRPVFAPVEVEISSERLILQWRANRAPLCCVNFPTVSSIPLESVEVFADGDRVPLHQVGSISTQYGIERLCQTAPQKAGRWWMEIVL